MHFVDLLLAGAVLLGHFSFCVWCFNRSQALDWSRPLLKAAKRVMVGWGFLGMLIFALRWQQTGVCIWNGTSLTTGDAFRLLYPLFCLGMLLLAFPLWLWPKLTYRIPQELRSSTTRVVDLQRELGQRPLAGWKTLLAAGIPGNQILFPVVEQKRLALTQLPANWAGLKIAHLTDLHMTGKFTPAFYHWLVDETNRQRPDLIVLTGDLVEEVECLDWILPTLGRLRAPLGKFFVLGNHDKRLPNVTELRERLTAAGCEDAGGKCYELSVRGNPLLLAGNELPWFGSLPHLPSVGNGPPAFRLLLAHTPDQFAWAQRQQFDLMLAGHNHGGQICLPGIGALFSPSLSGVRYSGGLFRQGPTLLHVSRGLAGVDPVRFNCPPELAILELVT